MRRIWSAILLAILLIGCGENAPENTMQLTGEISELKKGVLLLQRLNDTSLVTVDSVMVEGDSKFAFEVPVDSPEMMFLYLKTEGTIKEDRIAFFAEPQPIHISSSLKMFGLDVVINGSENQRLMDEYAVMIKRYIDRNLDLIEAIFEAQQQGNTRSLDSLQQLQNKLVATKYLATVNFAINNSDKEVAPYLMLTEAYEVNTKYLDTVYNALEAPVKTSLYGKKLEEFIAKRKAN
jgi:hypothetical protein